jgi:hypothetical protein
VSFCGAAEADPSEFLSKPERSNLVETLRGLAALSLHGCCVKPTRVREMGYRRLTLREALASDRLEDFVRQEEARGVELANGSDLERALALLITQRRLEDRSFTRALEKK